MSVYENVFVRELRVYYGQDENNIHATSLSRTGVPVPGW